MKLIIEGYNKSIHKKDNQIIVKEKDEVIYKIPADDIEDITIVGKGYITFDALSLLSRNNVNLITVNYFGQVEYILETPNQKYTVKGIEFQTIPAYNVNKQFHPKANEWVGYVLKIEGVTYYIAGDTDITEENKKVKCDVAFVPVGGTFTMDYRESAELINEIKPKIAVPTHYGSIVGEKSDGVSFSKLVSPEIEVEVLMK